ncbi:MAG: aldo/keto reductase [Kineosporiaceae bacterium]
MTIPSITVNNGVVMPALGFGVFQTPPEETAAAVQAALATGYRHIDTAAAQGNEHGVAEGIRRSGIDPSEILVETKIWISDYGYDATLHAFDKSAGKLGTDRIDLLLLHQTLPGEFDLTLGAYRALETLLADGQVRAIGGITFYRDGSHGSTLADPTILQIAAAHGRTAAQVMLRWHLQQGRSVIPKSVTPARIAENFAVFDFELTTDELAAIDALDTGVRGGPEPSDITRAKYGRDIPEA